MRHININIDRNCQFLALHFYRLIVESNLDVDGFPHGGFVVVIFELNMKRLLDHEEVKPAIRTHQFASVAFNIRCYLKIVV